MKQAILGGVVALVLVGVGVVWWQGRAQVEEAAPPPEPVAVDTHETDIPASDAQGMQGPAPPEATELTREERRFFRYDRNRDRRISRNEMLSTRTDAFRKLDKDGNNLLTFEEWAVATVNRFESADADANGELSQAEFATTRPPRRPQRTNCRC